MPKIRYLSLKKSNSSSKIRLTFRNFEIPRTNFRVLFRRQGHNFERVKTIAASKICGRFVQVSCPSKFPYFLLLFAEFQRNSSKLALITFAQYCTVHLGCLLLHNLYSSLFLVEFRIASIKHGMSLRKEHSDYFFFSYSVQSTFALRTPCYYGHTNNTDSKVHCVLQTFSRNEFLLLQTLAIKDTTCTHI